MILDGDNVTFVSVKKNKKKKNKQQLFRFTDLYIKRERDA